MPYKDLGKRRAHARAYYEKNKEELNRKGQEYYQKNIEKLRRANIVYNATHKEVRTAYRATHKDESAAYYEKNKEELNRKGQEYYQKNREAVIQRTKKYRQENKEWYKKYYQKKYENIKLQVLAKIDPAMKCANCGCDETRFLEVNHIKGGGGQENKKRGKKVTRNMILLIHTGKRGLEDLNLLCRVCNQLDHLERVYGPSGSRVVWDKQVTKYPLLESQKLLVSKR